MGMTIDNVLEILEKHKLHIPSNVFYELKADIVNFEEPTTKNEAKYCDRNICLKNEYNNVGCEDCEVTKSQESTKNDLGVDCISRADAERILTDLYQSDICDYCPLDILEDIKALPSVTPQEPKCKNCKWWKDSDGEYRRGCGAESQCPINRREVFEGNGYCYLFEPQESEDT